MFCPSCGKEQPPGASFCFSCGAKLTATVDVDKTQVDSGDTAVGEESLEPPGSHDRKLASFGFRAGAFIFDYGVLFLLLLIIGLVFPSVFEDDASAQLLGIAGLVLYHTLFLSVWSSTPGKKLYGLKVLHAETDGDLGFGRALGRSAAYLISSLLFGLGFWWVAFDKKRQAWHDSIAQTRVVVEQRKDLSLAIVLTIIVAAVALVSIAIGLSMEAAETSGYPYY